MVVLLFVFAPALIGAKGQGEERDLLAEAQALITEKRYDEARKLLAEIIRRDPNKFDAVDKLMEQILQAAAQLSDKLEQIEKTLFEELDEEKALALVEEYRVLDPFPNPRTQGILKQIERGAEIVNGLRSLNALMDDAAEALRTGEYGAAIEAYLPGFEVFAEAFGRAEYGNIVTGAVDAAVGRIFDATENFRELVLEIRDAFSAYTRALSEYEPDVLAERAAAIIDSLEVMVAKKKTVNEADIVLQSQFDLLREQTGRDDYYLYAAKLLLQGRTSGYEVEGIVHIFDLLYEESFAEAIQATTAAADDAFALLKERFLDGRYEEILPLLADARAVQRALMKMQYFSSSGSRLGDEYELAWQEVDVIPAVIAVFIEIQSEYRQTYAYERYIEIVEELENLGGLEIPSTVEVLPGARDSVERASVGLASLYRQWNGYADSLREVAPQSASSARELADRFGAAIGEFLEQYRRLAVSSLAENVASLEQVRERLLNGEALIISADPEIIRIEKYPEERRAELDMIRDGVLLFKDAIEEALADWGIDRQDVFQNSAVAERWTAVRELGVEAELLLGDVQAAIATATEEAIQADRYLREGQKFFLEAQSEFGRKLYDDARESVILAMESLERSLSYREDAEVRRLRDEEYPAFFNDISLRENEKVITEVRGLIRTGIQLYRGSQYEEAQSVLVQAQSRWRDINPADNEEVADWLTLVRKAINLKKGWEITEMEAPYEQLTQLLRLSSADYSRALGLKEDGRDRDAEDAFQDALMKLDQIKINFPKLKEANTLRLQIIRILEPEAYQSAFGQELAKAQNTLSGGDQQEVLETYSVLKDYERMESGNRALDELIYRYEITLGLRLPPTSQTDVTESRKAYLAAADIYEKRQRDLYSTAIDLLNSALKLWPDNTDAENLKDDLLRNLGQVKQTLTTDDVQKIEEAERLFSEREYTAAYRIVKPLADDPKNLGSERIMDLLKKLETRLGLGEGEG